MFFYPIAIDDEVFLSLFLIPLLVFLSRELSDVFITYWTEIIWLQRLFLGVFLVYLDILVRILIKIRFLFFSKKLLDFLPLRFKILGN